MPWTMIAVSIGAQYINNQLASKKNEELQKRQREFQKATQQKDFEKMRRLQRESAQLQLEIDAEVHKQRLDDIQANYDEVSQNIATDIAIEKWPLKVLPFVMRGQSFGTLFNGSKSIAMHCIFTPSNCNNFNEAVYTDIDMRLESLCNERWNVMTSHPVAYYGGSWRRDPFDLDHVDLLRTQINKVPTVVITPYFTPKLCFKIKLWGMGNDVDLRIDIPDGIFSYEYEKNMSYAPQNDIPQGDLRDRTIEEFVQYLESLIGYIADKYFWEFYGFEPLLPHLIDNKSMIANNLKDIYRPHYGKLYLQEVSGVAPRLHSNPQSIINLYNSIRCLVGDDIPYPAEAAHLINMKSLNISIWFCASFTELSAKIKYNNSHTVFHMKRLSNRVALGTFDHCNPIKNMVVILCKDLKQLASDFLEIDIQQNKIHQSFKDFFNKIEIDLELAEQEYIRHNIIFEKAKTLYDNLSSSLDLEEYLHVNNRFPNDIDINLWIEKNKPQKATTFQLVKSYSEELKKYLLLGVYYLDSDPLWSEMVLISYYETFPKDIDRYFLTTNKHSFNLI